MFKSKIEKDNLKDEQTHYYLTQGDSCTITSTPYKNGTVTTDVKSCVFKLANQNYEQVFSKALLLSGGAYVLNLTSEETKEWKPGTYIYEIEYTTTTDEVQTPHSWYFDIVKQIEPPKTTE